MVFMYLLLLIFGLEFGFGFAFGKYWEWVCSHFALVENTGKKR
jgi:hypothetical protein